MTSSNLRIVVWFQVFLSNTNDYMILIKYFYLIIIMFAVIWFQGTNNKIVSKQLGLQVTKIIKQVMNNRIVYKKKIKR